MHEISLERRVLVLAPTGKDGTLICQTLAEAKVGSHLCANLEELCRESQSGVGAALIAEEGLKGNDDVDRLRLVFDCQPPWSEVPLLLLTVGGQVTRQNLLLGKSLAPRVNLTFLERPLRMLTLVSAVQSALRARQRQYEVRDLLERAEKEVKQRDRFLAMLGHELRNPLAAIRTAVEIVQQFGDSEPALVQEQSRVIGRQSENMTRLVDDLLDVARITSGRIELTKKVIDLRDVVQRSVESIQLALRERSHAISVNTAAEPLFVNGDSVRLEQVMTNLLSNAVRHSPRGRRVEVEVAKQEGVGQVRVLDHGDGIDEQLIANIFEPFVQGAQSLARSRGGLGLGLTVVRSLVERHGGHVSVKSDGVGQGSEFTVQIPLSMDAPAVESPFRIAQTRQGKRILVVEDNPDVRMTLVRLLERQGHEVYEAEDGSSGLSRILSLKPELAFVDIGLPGLDGYSVAAQARAALGQDVHLVAVTGYGQTEDKERALAHGFDSHLVKPVNFQSLYQLIGYQNGS